MFLTAFPGGAQSSGSSVRQIALTADAEGRVAWAPVALDPYDRPTAAPPALTLAIKAWPSRNVNAVIDKIAA
jgi:hypothetical protein